MSYFTKKKLPTSQKTPYHFPAEVGSTPYTPPVCVRGMLMLQSTSITIQQQIRERFYHHLPTSTLRQQIVEHGRNKISDSMTFFLHTYIDTR